MYLVCCIGLAKWNSPGWHFLSLILMFSWSRMAAYTVYSWPRGYRRQDFFFLFFILRRHKFLIYKFTNSTMNINSYTNCHLVFLKTMQNEGSFNSWLSIWNHISCKILLPIRVQDFLKYNISRKHWEIKSIFLFVDTEFPAR